MTKISHDSETPAHGQQVFTACAFIHQIVDSQEKVFLTKRALSKKFYPGAWEMPGGHIDFGEDMRTGLAREIKEELDMEISVGDPFFEFTYTNPVKGSHSIEIIYFCRFTSPTEQMKFSPEDFAEVGWFGESEIESKMKEGRQPGDTKEYQAAVKAFALLRGEHLDFA